MMRTFSCTLSRVSAAFDRKTRSTGPPRKMTRTRARDRASMLMKGGNSSEHKADREEEGGIRGERRGGDQEPRSGGEGGGGGGALV